MCIRKRRDLGGGLGVYQEDEGFVRRTRCVSERCGICEEG